MPDEPIAADGGPPTDPTSPAPSVRSPTGKSDTGASPAGPVAVSGVPGSEGSADTTAMKKRSIVFTQKTSNGAKTNPLMSVLSVIMSSLIFLL